MERIKNDALTGFILTAEEEVQAMTSFSDVQKAFFQTRLRNAVIARSKIKFDFASPLAHLQEASELDGAIAIWSGLLNGGTFDNIGD